MFAYRLDSFLDYSDSNRQRDTRHTYKYARPVGITTSDKEIFTIHCGEPDIQVFDSETFEHLRTIPVPTLKNACKIRLGDNSVFVEEANAQVGQAWVIQVHKIPLNSSELASCRSFSFRHDFYQVPTSNPGSIFVRCQTTNKLMVYNTSEPSVERQYNVEVPINYLYDAIQLDNNNLLLALNDRVCLVGSAGKVIRTYGGPDIKGDVVHPCCLAVAEDGSVVVADKDPANRIILLNKELTFVKELIPQISGLNFSYYNMSIFMDRYRNRLFVRMCNEQRIIVFDLLY